MSAADRHSSGPERTDVRAATARPADEDPPGQRRRQVVQLAQPHADRRHRAGFHPRAAVRGVQRRDAAAHRRRHDLLGVFTEDANLKADDDVRIAGVKVGEVERRPTVDGNKVKVPSRSRTASSATRAPCEIKLRRCSAPSTSRSTRSARTQQDPARRSRCRAPTSPFDVYPAFTELTEKIDAINTTQLAQSFDTLADDFRGTPKSVQAGRSRGLSPAVGHDRLARRAAAHPAGPGQRGHRRAGRPRPADCRSCFSDGSLLLDELNARRDAIHSLLINTTTLSHAARGPGRTTTRRRSARC